MILAEYEAKRLLEESNIPVVPVRVVDSTDAARLEAERFGYPVVLKLCSAVHTHKTEVGGVILDIGDSEQLEQSMVKLSNLRDRLDPRAVIIVEPMAKSGAELFIGVQKHEKFGLVISLGLGGIWLELLQDVSFRLLPARRCDYREMLSELQAWPKLRSGFRHLPAVDETQLLDLIERVGAFASARPDLREMDLNPVMAYADRAVVVDARMVMVDVGC
jgi:succinyl-CoA synthetase beta subunit